MWITSRVFSGLGGKPPLPPSAILTVNNLWHACDGGNSGAFHHAHKSAPRHEEGPVPRLEKSRQSRAPPSSFESVPVFFLPHHGRETLNVVPCRVRGSLRVLNNACWGDSRRTLTRLLPARVSPGQPFSFIIRNTSRKGEGLNDNFPHPQAVNASQALNCTCGAFWVFEGS